MTTRRLDKAQWPAFFDDLSKTLEDTQAEIEVASLALGHQVEADWLPLHGVTYDRKDDLVEVNLEGLDHLIRKPRDIHLETHAGSLTSLEIVDVDGVKQVVRLRQQSDRQPLPTGF